MKRVLAAAVLVSFMPTANAQDKGKADMTHNAEFRARYFQMQNPGGDEDTLANQGMGMHRFKMDLGFRASEKLSAAATLLHAEGWGASNDPTATPATSDTIGQTAAGLFVNQAYGTWMTSEDLSFKLGRQNYQIADGTLMSINEWEANPNSFDGLLANYEAEFGKFQFFAFKYREIEVDDGATHPAANTSASGDPEHNAYGLNFDLKTMPEWLKGVNVHVIKDNQDALVGNTTTTTQGLTGQDLLRYGLMAKFGFSIVDLGLWYEANTGKYKNIAAGGAKTELDAKQSLMAAEVGVSFANFMNSRVSIRYHKDSGDETGSADEVGTYDGYFTQKHCSVGCMDLFGYGNTTFIKVGWDLKTSDSTDVGLAYWMISKSEAADGATEGNFGGALPGEQADKDELGSEIDLWATHKYDGGLSTTARVGYFTAGDVYTANNGPDDAIIHVMLEGKWNF